MEEKIRQLEKRIEIIEKRNKQVESAKAWETSLIRVFSITITTYILTGLVFWILNISKPFLNAFIPTIGFFLSVQSLPFIKRKWMKSNNKK